MIWNILRLIFRLKRSFTFKLSGSERHLLFFVLPEANQNDLTEFVMMMKSALKELGIYTEGAYQRLQIIATDQPMEAYHLILLPGEEESITNQRTLAAMKNILGAIDESMVYSNIEPLLTEDAKLVFKSAKVFKTN